VTKLREVRKEKVSACYGEQLRQMFSTLNAKRQSRNVKELLQVACIVFACLVFFGVFNALMMLIVL